jgi:hypothetical protein
MADLRTAAQQALEALDEMEYESEMPAIAALRAALAVPARPLCKGIPRRGCNYLNPCDTACNKCGEIHHHHQMVAQFQAAEQPEQEPVAIVAMDVSMPHLYYGGEYLGQKPDSKMAMLLKGLPVGTMLYTHPPRREWQGLTDDENNELSITMVKGHKSVNWLARTIEAALRSKNHE